MKCKSLISGIISLAHGELDMGEAPGIQRHLESCRRCRATYEEYRRNARLLKALPEAPEASLGPERLRRAILSSELRSARRRIWGWAVTAGAAAAGALAVWAILGPLSPSDPGGFGTDVVAANNERGAQRSSLESGDVIEPAPDRDTNAAAEDATVPMVVRVPVKTEVEKPVPAPDTTPAGASPLTASGVPTETAGELIVIRFEGAGVDGTKGATELMSPNDVAIGG
ncbi:MAG: hypothetical protein IH851_12245 [Armatimonadetes bacterium]|nr:hypothetical protein [Armatimonadota bacterium]